MHKKSLNIVKSLGFGQSIADDLEQFSGSESKRELFQMLKHLKLPSNAAKQIKKIEDCSIALPDGQTGEELLQSLIKKCKRSLDAFAKKGVQAHIVFDDNTWVLYSEEFSNSVCKLHTVCKPYFDAWASRGLQATIIFTGTDSWKAKIKNL